MPSTITVKEVLRQVSTLLQDNSPQFVRHPETELVDWLNDAQRAVFKFLPAACSRIDSIKLSPGTLQSIDTIAAANCKPGDGTTPTVAIVGSMLMDVQCNMGADGLTAGTSIRAITNGRDALDTVDPLWQTRTATVIEQYMYDPKTPRNFLVSPGVPASPAVWARVSYVAMPIIIPNTGTPGSELYAASGASTVKVSIPDEHTDDLVNYVCARALMKNAQYASMTNAAGFASMFTGSINMKAQAIMGYNPNLQQLPFTPSVMGAAS